MVDLMKLKEFMPNAIIQITLSDLLDFHELVIKNVRIQLEDAVVMQKTETYLSPKKVAVLLEINPSTLWRWEKEGYLIPLKVGGSNKYKMSDINKILESK